MSTGPVLRAGIVGAGWIGRRHAETIAGRDDIEAAAAEQALATGRTVRVQT